MLGSFNVELLFPEMRVYVVGEHRRFIGVWTTPRPTLVSSVDGVIAYEANLDANPRLRTLGAR